MKIEELIVRYPFNELFPIDPLVQSAVSESMQSTGFNHGFPIHVWYAEEGYVVIDGHTRIKAAIEAGINDVPVHILSFPGENAALLYACKIQRDRRNMSRDEIKRHLIMVVQEIDNRRKRGGDHTSEEAKAIVPSGTIAQDSAQEVAEAVGTSVRQVKRARAIVDTGDEDLINSVKNGDVTLNQGDIIAQEMKKEKKETEHKSMFNRTNDNIEWAQWSWNPVTGCKYGCSYCYARDIANRFFEEKFEPTFRPERLEAPANTKPIAGPGGSTVFVCSMADLFGDWVPNEWIFSVLDQIQKNPQWTFILLTKNPERLKSFQFPDNAWVGTTIDSQARAEAAQEHMPNVNANVRFLSCEPLLEHVSFKDLTWCDWVIIGGRSRNSAGEEVQPEWSWVWDLTMAAYGAGCKVYWKPNLTVRPREYPN